MTPSGSTKNWPALLFRSLGLFVLVAGYLGTASRQDEALDIHIHDTYVVMPVMLMPWALAVACLIIALLYVAFRRLLRRPLNTKLGVVHFITTAIALFAMSAPMLFFWSLMSDAPRRYYSYTKAPMLEGTIDLMTIVSVLVIIGLLGHGVFLFNIVRSLLRPRHDQGS